MSQNEIDQLNKEIMAVQEMLALVLLTVGEPVFVSHETMEDVKRNGWKQAIAVEEDLRRDGFEFKLVPL